MPEPSPHRTLRSRGGRPLAEGLSVFVQVSPHPILAMPLTHASAAAEGVVVGSLERDRGDLSQILQSFAALCCQGVP